MTGKGLKYKGKTLLLSKEPLYTLILILSLEANQRTMTQIRCISGWRFKQKIRTNPVSTPPKSHLTLTYMYTRSSLILKTVHNYFTASHLTQSIMRIINDMIRK